MNKKPPKPVKLKFFLYPLYALIFSIILFRFMDEIMFINSRVHLIRREIVPVIPWVLVASLFLAFVCNLYFYSHRNTMHKKFLASHYKFMRIMIGLTAGILLSEVAYTYPPVSSQLTPTSNTSDKLSTEAVADDITTLSRNIDYLVGTSNYFDLDKRFSNKDININNSVFTLHEYPTLKSYIADGKRSLIPHDAFSRILPSNENDKDQNLQKNKEYEKVKIATDLNISDTDIVLGYTKIYADEFNKYTDVSFSANISGGTGECFQLLSRTIWNKEPTDTNTSNDGIGANLFCINAENRLSNTLFIKAKNIKNANSIEFWLVPTAGNKINIEVNRKSGTNSFFIEETILGFRQSNDYSDRYDNTQEMFCIQGFHKGNPDHHVYMMEKSIAPEEGYCPP